MRPKALGFEALGMRFQVLGSAPVRVSAVAAVAVGFLGESEVLA
jgi:hypothetical protein